MAVAVEVEDVGSGATTRPQQEKLVEATRRREIDLVLVWRLDRWGAVTGGPDEWDAVILMAQSISTTP